MTDSKGYDQKKEFKCVSCGCMTMATKFASASKVQCDKCKADKRLPDPEILKEIEESKKKKVSADKAEVDPNVPADKKKSKCIKCGTEVLIGKFASHNKTMCDDCKGVSKDDDGEYREIKIDLSKVDREQLPDMAYGFVSPVVINNRRLRNVDCPACGHEDMKIIKILDANPVRGLVIMYQCHTCLTALTLSEQSITKLKPSPEHVIFNYRAEQIIDMLEDITDVRARNTIDYLMELLKSNDIPVDGEIPHTPRLNDGDIGVDLARVEEDKKDVSE